jgi:hypothetical protein
MAVNYRPNGGGDNRSGGDDAANDEIRNPNPRIKSEWPNAECQKHLVIESFRHFVIS